MAERYRALPGQLQRLRKGCFEKFRLDTNLCRTATGGGIVERRFNSTSVSTPSFGPPVGSLVLELGRCR